MDLGHGLLSGDAGDRERQTTDPAVRAEAAKLIRLIVLKGKRSLHYKCAMAIVSYGCTIYQCGVLLFWHAFIQAICMFGLLVYTVQTQYRQALLSADPDIKCPRGHLLFPRGVPFGGGNCDGCDRMVHDNEVLLTCPLCPMEWWLCPTCDISPRRRRPSSSCWRPLRHVRQMIEVSVQTQMIDPILLQMFTTKAESHDSVMVLLAPIMMFSIEEVTIVNAFGIVLGLMLSLASLGNELAGCQLGDAHRQMGEIVVNARYTNRCGGGHIILALWLWTASSVTIECAVFNVVAKYAGILWAVLSLLPQLVALRRINIDVSTAMGWHWWVLYVVSPMQMLANFQASVFGLMKWSFNTSKNLGNLPAWPLVIAQTCRFIAVCIWLFAYGDYGEFHKDCAALSAVEHVLCGQTTGDNFKDWNEAACGPRTAGYALLCGFIVVALLVTLPAHAFTTLVLLKVNRAYRKGEKDDQANALMVEMQEAKYEEVGVAPPWKRH